MQLWCLAVQRGAGARTVTIDIVTQHAYNHATVTPRYPNLNYPDPRLSGSQNYLAHDIGLCHYRTNAYTQSVHFQSHACRLCLKMAEST